jgi:hypothetical protein
MYNTLKNNINNAVILWFDSYRRKSYHVIFKWLYNILVGLPGTALIIVNLPFVAVLVFVRMDCIRYTVFH